MQTVLADLALESEAATALGMRLAGAVDRDERELLRLALPAAKYLVCKRTPTVVAEALECLGGNGYVEDSGLPRLLPGGAAELDLGGLGQRHRAGRAARGHPGAGLGGRGAGRDRRGGRRGLLVRPRGAGAAHRAARPGGAAGPADRRAAGAVPAGQPAAAVRAGRGASAFVTSRFLPDGPWRTAGTLPADAPIDALLARSRPPLRDQVTSRGGAQAAGAAAPGRPPRRRARPAASSPNGFTPGPAASACATCTCRHFTRSGMPPALTSVPERLDRVPLGQVGPRGRAGRPRPARGRRPAARSSPASARPPPARRCREHSRAQVR